MEGDGGNSESMKTNSRGQKLCCKCWLPSNQQPSKLVFVCHGHGDHSGRYGCIVEKLTEQGFYVFAHDHVGHGKSEGSRVHIDDFRFFVEDVVQHVTEVKAKFPGLPCYIVGHSMGGAVAILTGLDHPDLFKGMVLIAPAIQADANVATPFKRFLARLLSRLLPEFQVGALSEELMSRNKQEVESFKADPLCWQGGVKAKMGVEIMNVFTEIERRSGEFKTPYLLLHGTKDGICLIDASCSFHQHTSSHDKTFTEYEGAYHSVHHEPEGQGQEAVEEIASWIKSR